MVNDGLKPAQRVLLYLLVWSGRRGRHSMSRTEIALSPDLTPEMAGKLQAAALLMPKGLISWDGTDSETFRLTAAGRLAHARRYGDGAPLDEMRELMEETGMARHPRP